MDDFGHHGWGFGWGWILGVLVLVVLVWFIARSINSDGLRGGSSEKSAIEILKERYARGEIDKEEYEHRKKDLM